MSTTSVGKTALVTGASSGIGNALATLHAERGGDLIVVARSEDKLNKLKEELEAGRGSKVTIVVKDLAEQGAATDVYEAVKEAGLTVDYLINNAGFGGRGKFHEREWQQDLSMINVNVVALVELTRRFLPDFVARNEGKVLNVSSTAALVPGPLQAVYYATKAFVTSFSNALAEELHDTAITVTALMPGATDTEFASTSGMDKTNLFDSTSSAREVAEAGYSAMLDGKLDIIAGVSTAQRLVMSAAPLFPKRLMMRQIRQMQEVK